MSCTLLLRGMVGKDGRRVSEASEAWIRIKIAKGWSGARNCPIYLAGKIHDNRFTRSYLTQIGMASFKAYHATKCRGISNASIIRNSILLETPVKPSPYTFGYVFVLNNLRIK